MIRTFRKLPIEVQMVEWTGDNVRELALFTEGLFKVRDRSWEYNAEVYDRLHDTWAGLRVGQLVVKGPLGEFYPMEPEALAVTYEEVFE